MNKINKIIKRQLKLKAGRVDEQIVYAKNPNSKKPRARVDLAVPCKTPALYL
jgi:hypothetical protein